MAQKEIAIAKRAAIDKASKKMFLAVCAASVILGLGVVASIYFIKWMAFNGKVISRKGEIITDYKVIQGNLDKLKVNIIGDGGDNAGLAGNTNLEVMARSREAVCIDVEGNPIVDTNGSVEAARTCSALRVIPDALPSVRNDEAVYASLNKLFLVTGEKIGQNVQPESISPGGNGTTDPTTGLTTIPIALAIQETGSTTRAILDTIERSIRNIDISAATISWFGSEGTDNDIIELRGTAVAYYSNPIEAAKKSEVINADDEKAKAKAKK